MAKTKSPHPTKKIKDLVVKGAKQGLSMNQIWHQVQVQTWQNIPRSPSTFYKYYQTIYEATLAEEVGEVGQTVFQQAKQGDYKSQELVMTTVGKWSKKEVVEHREVEEEDNVAAIQSLMSILKIKDED